MSYLFVSGYTVLLLMFGLAPTLYATYRRLEKDGLVESYWGDETQGGRRKYYRITDAGRATFRNNVAAWIATRRIIDALLDSEPLEPQKDAAS